MWSNSIDGVSRVMYAVSQHDAGSVHAMWRDYVLVQSETHHVTSCLRCGGGTVEAVQPSHTYRHQHATMLDAHGCAALSVWLQDATMHVACLACVLRARLLMWRATAADRRAPGAACVVVCIVATRHVPC